MSDARPHGPATGADATPDLLELGVQYRRAYERTGSVQALELSVLALESLLPEAAPGTEARLVVAGNLGLSLRARYEHAGDPADLARAVALHEEAALGPSDSPHAAGRLSNLAGSLRMRYGREGRVEDLTRAVAAYERAVALTPEDSPWRSTFLNNLGNGLRTTFERSGEAADIDGAVSALRAAAAAAADGSADQLRALGNLAGALGERYLLTGDRADGDEAVAVAERALAHGAGTASEADQRTALSVALARLYGGTGQLDLLDRAIEEQYEAARRSHPRAPGTASRVDNLAGSLDLRHRVAGDPADLDQAIRLHELAVSLQDEREPVAWRRHANLGSAYLQRFQADGARSDLEAAVAALRRSVAAAERLGGGDGVLLAGVRLAHALIVRLEADGTAEGLDEAIAWFERGTRELPEGTDAHMLSRLYLADALVRSPRARRGGAPVARLRALIRTACRDALERAPELALFAARSWSGWAVGRHAWSEAAEAGQLALDAAQRLFATQALRPHREAWLGKSQGLAAETAMALARTGDLEGAVAVLERGQALLLSEALDRERVRLDALERAGHEALVAEYRAAAARVGQLQREELDQPLEVAAPRRTEAPRRARAELDAVVERIRRLEGFGDFLQPARFEDAVAAAAECPLVYLAATSWRGLALVVRQGHPTRVAWLPKLTRAELAARFRAFAKTYDSDDVAEAMQGVDDVTAWAWRAMAGPLLRVLAHDRRVRLVPVGALALLPLHAAWTPKRSAPDGRRYLLDTVTPSFAPNARAFAVADARAAAAGGTSLLVVADPQPVAAGELPFAVAEARHVGRWFAGARHLEGPDATRERVLRALAGHDVLHLACHGRADLARPLAGGLLLADDESLSLRELLTRRLDGVRLTVLSACETALPGTALPDEAIGLPAGLIQAGSAGVLCSLWRVADASTMALMARFYEGWRADALAPAEALRQAQLWVRTSTDEEKVRCFPEFEAFAAPAADGADAEPEAWGDARSWTHPYLWAAFIHVGA